MVFPFHRRRAPECFTRQRDTRDLAGGDPDLVRDYRRHEDQIEAERPKDEKFTAFQVTAGNGMLLRVRELIVFERGQDEGLVEGGDGKWSGLRFGHRARTSR